jgi:serine/threonine protein kinase
LASLDIGTVVAQRFQIEAPAGEGGMSTVFRAHDWYTDQTVALKILRRGRGHPREVERFQREVAWLEKLHHPGIVAYISHGRTPQGMLFLAMEWLDGEDLSRRLGRGPLDVQQTLVLAARIADALGEAHRQEIVHRDIKPSNLLLRNDKIEQVTVLDFGIARDLNSTMSLTATGAVVGTPEYMAPEQARGSHEIGPSADVFSLGAVLYHCLTGRPPFTGQHVASRLAKLLFEPVQPPSVFRPDIPAPLEDLLMRMLDKDPSRRPGDAAALAREIAVLQAAPAHELAESARPRPAALTTSEEWVMSVVVASMHSTIDQSAPTLEADTAVDLPAPSSTLHEELEAMGARVEWLADGSLVAVQAPAGNALEQVAQAARCALQIKQTWPMASVALSTGTAALLPHAAVGEVIDRAVAMVRQLVQTTRGATGNAAASAALPRGVIIDQASAALLDHRFELVHEDQATLLVAERTSADHSRPLLGKPTPCLGREQELRVLEAALDGCIEARAACAVRITAPPGVGKSRLRHEFVRRIAERHAEALVLVGHGEPLSAGSPYALLGQALRRLCGIASGEARDVARDKLCGRMARHLAAADAERIIEFLGELCNVPFPDQESPRLQAARRDPRVMHRQVQRAALNWLEAECAHAPIVLVLEDLQWGDALSIRLVDSALGELCARPLLVLALAHPEIDELFPAMWDHHNLHQIRLANLSRQASEALILQVLGADLAPATRARIVDQAGGNALHLEELIRAAAEGKGDSLPGTVLSMLQARLLRLDADARLLLRAASVFGETFWAGGAAELFGQGAAEDIGAIHDRLEAAEVIERQHHGRYPSEIEYRFRHALMRDAAYSMLTGDDRKLGHRLAGHFLERVGEDDPMILAEHAQRGDELERAVRFYVAAALQSYDSNDDDATLARAEHGLACQAQGEALGTLHALIAQISFLRGQPAAALPRAAQALEHLPAGSLRWYKAFGTMFAVASVLARRDVLADLLPAFLGSEPAPDARGAYIEAAATQVVMLSAGARRDGALPVLEHIEAVIPAIAPSDLLSHAWARHSRAYYLHVLGDDPFAALQLEERACRGFAEAGDLRSQVYAEVVRGLVQKELGLLDQAEHTLRGAHELAARLMEPFLIAYAGIYAAHFLADCGRSDDAEALLGQIPAWALEIPALLGHEPLIRGKIQWRRGLWDQAREALRAASESLKLMGGLELYALASLVTFLVERGDTNQARELAESGVAVLEQRGGGGFAEVPMLVATAVARDAAGDRAAAAQALAGALAAMATRAARIADDAIRTAYRSAEPDNARALVLAREWALTAP